MESKFYNTNDEQKFNRLIQDLKNLPKIKAEENFEYNLMIKIQNKNFDLSIPERAFIFNRRLVPAAVFAFSVLVLFFIVSEPGTGLENPLLSDPPVRADYSQSKVDTIELTNPEVSVSAVQPMAEQSVEEVQPQQNIVRVVVEPSDAVTVEKVELPFSDDNSVDLDSFVKGKSKTSSTIIRGQIVSGGSQSSQFDGFLIREKASREAIEAHRARCDSLQKAQKTDKK